MKPYFLLFFFLLSSVRNANAQGHYDDSLIYAKVEALPEVMHMVNEDEQLHKKDSYFLSQIHLTIKAKPTVDAPRYWVQVQRSRDSQHWPGVSDEVVYNFFVYPERSIVYYYDPKTDSTFTLNEWRHRSNYAIPSMK